MSNKSVFRGASKMLAGASALYVFMAACSVATSVTTATGNDTGSPSDDGSVIGRITDAASSLADAIVRPTPDAKAEPVTSGSRLKAKVLTGTDGSRQVNAYVFRDTALNADCTYTKMADGNTYCVPTAGYGTPSPNYYSTPNCGTPIAAFTTISTCAPLPDAISFKAAVTPPSCGGDVGPRMYQRGPQLSGLYVQSGANCVDVTSSFVTATSAVYSLGAEIPLSTYVRATESIE